MYEHGRIQKGMDYCCYEISLDDITEDIAIIRPPTSIKNGELAESKYFLSCSFTSASRKCFNLMASTT